jgi:geranylgeranyl pyrophosphate synthase
LKETDSKEDRLDLSSIQAPFTDELASVGDGLRELMVPEILEAPMAEKLLAIADGDGLHATFFMVTASAFGGFKKEQISLAAGCELFRLATWVHDAVIDETPVEGWPREQMIISGDHIFSTGLTLLTAGPAPAGDIAGTMIQSMAVGELEYVREDPTTTTQRHIRMLSDKYGSLFGASCELAAIHGDVDSEKLSCLSEYGRSLGTAYKIVDEIVNLAGIARRGRVALPILYASDPTGEIPRLFSERDAEGLVDLCSSNGGLGGAKAQVTQLGSKALDTLSSSGIDSEPMRNLCAWVTERVD